MIITTTIGFLLIIPQYDTTLNSREFNRQESQYNRALAHNYATTYAILKQMNASQEVINIIWDKGLINYKYAITGLDPGYREEPLKSELDGINSVDELNDIFNQSASTFVNEYNTIRDGRTFNYYTFVVLNTLGLLFIAFGNMIKRD
jgi:hypothetical protein